MHIAKDFDQIGHIGTIVDIVVVYSYILTKLSTCYILNLIFLISYVMHHLICL